MDPISLGLNKLLGNVTSAATDAATAKAAAAYEQYKPLIWLGAAMGLAVFLFFFVPRFRWPWARAAS